MEASVSLKYNRNKHTVVADVLVPDYDIEAGIKLALNDNDVKGTKMRGIVIDVTNRNIPQLTLVGRTRFMIYLTRNSPFLPFPRLLSPLGQRK